MYKNALLIIVSLFLLACGEQKKANDFFEGYVDYDIKFEILDTLQSTRLLKKDKGSKMRCYFKDGYFQRDYLDGLGNTKMRFLYSPKSNQYFYIFSEGTIYKHSAVNDTTMLTNIEVKKGEQREILGYDCPSAISEMMVHTPSYKGPYSAQYFFCKDLLIDTSILKKITSGGYNQMIGMYPYAAIEFVEKQPNHYTATYTATKIVRKKLPQKTFSIPDREIKDL